MIPANQQEKARAFRALHQPGNPLVLINAWDCWSARAVAQHAAAIATSSYALAEAAGFEDGQDIPFTDMIGVVTKICHRVNLPVTVDIEAGFGDDAAAIRAPVAAVIQAGAVGINLEDGLHAGRRELVDPTLHAEKIAAARAIGDSLGVSLFINARIDTFLLDAKPGAATVSNTLQRAHLYHQAGADGVFVPGLVQPQWIAQVATAVKLPLNILAMPAGPAIAALAQLGVARISFGHWPFEMLRAVFQRRIEQFMRSNEAQLLLPTV